MRHGNYKYKLGVKPPHRKAMLRSLGSELIDHGKIKTTLTRCKALKPFIEKIITIAKTDEVSKRRLILSRLHNRSAVNKLFTEVAPKFKSRPGGYTRILRLADGRVGDNASMAYIELVD